MKTCSPEANWRKIFRTRRNRVRAAMDEGAILWMGHSLQPRNYANNAYPFRQNSHFLYYTGLAEPDLAMISFPEPDADILFARTADIDDIVWSGPRPSLKEMAYCAGIRRVEDVAKLKETIDGIRGQGRLIHYLPPYQYSSALCIARLLRTRVESVGWNASAALMEQVADRRSVKSAEEIAEIEDALAITDKMHRAAMAATRPGLRESDIAGMIQGIALSAGRGQAFDPIVTIHGEVLHNTSRDNVIEPGRLLLNDSGAESPMYYASDITRTYPADGKFTPRQAEIYRVVLDAQRAAISMIKPKVSYMDVHLGACRVLSEGLGNAGLMKGNPADAAEAGAHALFMPHSIGHMLGLDVHDMEDIGNILGYKKKNAQRRGPFGLNYLSLDRPLKTGFVLTVEPGVYFIPALIERWRDEKKFPEFINYNKLDAWLSLGGIRIEDNVLVTAKGSRLLGKPIPKTIEEVEAACARAAI
ncbi:MAG: aminopeptidase P family protein [Acidobacteria bacterium]|nr:aminopeptidase P family protein [Acidobacteriota bacterium]